MNYQSLLTKAKGYIPSRGWSVFWTCLGGVVGGSIYDRQATKSTLAAYCAQAALVADRPADWNSVNRKVIVYLDPTNNWGSYWFKEFVKPVWDAGAIEYRVVEPDEMPSEIIERVRTLVWKGKTMIEQEKRDRKKKEHIEPYTWHFGLLSPTGPPSTDETIKKEEEELNSKITKVFLPHLYKPAYNADMALVALGPNAWRHMLLGLEEGSLLDEKTNNPLTNASPQGERNHANMLPAEQMTYPTLGYISAANNSGFLRFHRRFGGWFTRRFPAAELGQQALDVVNAASVPFEQGMVGWGGEGLKPAERRKVKEGETPLSEKEARGELWTLEAEEKSEVDPSVAERLRVYARK